MMVERALAVERRLGIELRMGAAYVARDVDCKQDKRIQQCNHFVPHRWGAGPRSSGALPRGLLTGAAASATG